MATAGRRTVTREAHWIEWVTGIVSGLLIVVMTSWIAWHAATDTGGKPELTVSMVETKAVARGYEIALIIDNKGQKTAAAVPVTGELRDGDAVIETHTVTFDYVPQQSSVKGAILFEADPSTHDLHVRIDGYADP